MQRAQIKLLSKAGPDRRGQLASQMSNQAHWRAMQAIAKANPELSKLEQKILFVKIHYGQDLAQRVKSYLRKQSA